MIRFALLSFIILNQLWALSQAKPGVSPSPKVLSMSQVLANSYTHGGVVEKIRGNKDRYFMHRETIALGFPVLVGNYADARPEAWPVSDLQQELFDGPWPTPTMTEHYAEMSYGQFELSGAVYGWYQLSHNGEFYEGNQFEPYDNGFTGPPGGTGAFLQETLEAADITVDFTLYDNDGPDGISNSGDDDGFVDACFFVHSGSGGESGGPYIWSHRSAYSSWWGSPFTTNDPGANGGFVKVDDYIIQPAQSSNGGMIEIGVFSHEFGHILGLPDLYDRDYSSEGVGDWCLMAGGSWNTPVEPAHFSAWCKEALGWVEPISVTSNISQMEIPNVEQYPFVIKLWTHGQVDSFVSWYAAGLDLGSEYLLIENRQRLSTDVHLEGTGLLIWHIQNSVTSQNDDETDKLVDLEAADNFMDLDMGKNRGDDGDPFPGTTNNRMFNRSSFPNSNVHQGGFSKIAVENISDPGDTMVADFSVIADDLMYLSNIINDTSGNGNGYADPGETVHLKLELLNLGADISYFEITLSTDDLDITIVDSVAVYQNIMEDSIVWDTDNNFVFTVDPEADYHPITFTVNGTDGANHTENYQFVVMMENLYVLLVDDTYFETDEFGKPIISYYEEALILAGISYYSNWTIYSDGIPAIDILNNYRTLVWVTGSNQQTLGISEQAEIKDYLDNGGSLLITGQNIGKDLVSSGSESDSLFYANYLKAEYLADDPGVGSNILMTGIENDPISSGYRLYFFLSGGNSANNQTSPDIIAPVNEATGAMEYFGTSVMGKKSGIKYEGDYRLVYFAFGIEGINEFGTSNITRDDILKRSIGWLQEDPSIVLSVSEVSAEILPMEFLLRQNYPNPFNVRTTIIFDLPRPANVELVIYDILGRQVARLVSGRMETGRHSIIWDAGKIASGIYFYRLSAESIDASEETFSEERKLVVLK